MVLEGIPAPVWGIGLLLLLMPALASNFVLFQIFGWSFILGMIALSLMVLAGYGGMVSLIQMTVAALAGYVVAILGTSGVPHISLGWPWWLHIPLAILIATLFGTLVGALAVRTEGIYTIMITLAIAAAFFYFTRQNYVIFNGYTGFNNVVPPALFGVDWRQPVPFYYLTLGCATLSYLAVVWMARTPFGLALQGVRDNPRRMSALGFSVTAHRILAYSFASVIAAFGGILLVWQNAQVVPGTAGIPQVIDILVIAVVGGLKRPIGPFIGALIYTLLSVFSSDILHAFGMSGERFKLVVGLGFLAVVFFSPDGVLGLWERYRSRVRAQQPRSAAGRGGGAMMPSVAERLTATGANALELRGVTRMFGALAALTDVTLNVRPGERRAVLGSNGAGKTTLFNCVTGDFPSTSGTIRFFGEDVTNFPPHERIRRGLRRTYQISALFTGLSVLDNVYLACRGVARGRFSLVRPRRGDVLLQSAESLVEAVHLTGVRDQLVGELSHGQQRQLEIALALAGAPRFILFDEPAAGLSPSERGQLIEILTSLPSHIGFIIIEHDMDVALRVVESVTMLHNGRIFKEGRPEEIESDAEVQELYLGGGHG